MPSLPAHYSDDVDSVEIHNTQNSTDEATCGIIIQGKEEHTWISSDLLRVAETFEMDYEDMVLCNECWDIKVVKEL